MEGRRWCLLAEKTLAFIAIAKEHHFCIELLGDIRRRLYAVSPFPIHRKERKK